MWRLGTRSWKHLALVWCVWLLATCGVTSTTSTSSSKQAPTQSPNQFPTQTQTDSTPKLFTGKICCVDDEASPTSANNTCSDTTLSTDFSPLMYFNRSTLIPSDEITTWTPGFLNCGAGYYLDYMYFNGTRDSVLFVKENKIQLSYRDVYHKFTADFCMEKRDTQDYYVGLCRPNLTKVS